MGLVENLNKEYKFKIKQVASDVLYIDSGLDEWIVEVEPKLHSLHKNIRLKHGNWKRNKGRYHHQKDYLDLPFMFQSIYEHERRYLRNF
jgi:hypothetical protein